MSSKQGQERGGQDPLCKTFQLARNVLIHKKVHFIFTLPSRCQDSTFKKQPFGLHPLFFQLCLMCFSGTSGTRVKRKEEENSATWPPASCVTAALFLFSCALCSAHSLSLLRLSPSPTLELQRHGKLIYPIHSSKLRPDTHLQLPPQHCTPC